MNALVGQVRMIGDAYYNSKYEPRATSIRAGADFDPLAYMIKRARENGLEIHAWVNVYRVWRSKTKPPQANHVVNLHPEWLNKDANGKTTSKDGRFLDPGIPEVREFTVKLVADLLSKYDVDGLMLDFIRYPGKNWGYSEIAVARFNRKYGRQGKPSAADPVWCDWRREQVTEMMRAIYKEVHRLKPHVKVSAATISWGRCPSDFRQTDAYRNVFQDWRLWMQEGILDASMPMNYKNPSNSEHSQWFVDWLKGMKKWSYGRHVYCGLMIFKNNVSGAASQVKLSRDKAVHGVVGFAFSQVDSKAALASKLRSTVFAKPVATPSMPWKKPVAQRN